MKVNDVYTDLDGHEIVVAGLDTAERRMIAVLRRRARAKPDWDAFDNYWTVAVPAFYHARGLPRKAVPRTIGWRIAQDLSSRLGQRRAGFGLTIISAIWKTWYTTNSPVSVRFARRPASHRIC